MTRRPCWCPDPDAVDTTLCYACGRTERAVPPLPPLKGRIYEQDADGVEVLIYDSEDVGQLELIS